MFVGVGKLSKNRAFTSAEDKKAKAVGKNGILGIYLYQTCLPVERISFGKAVTDKIVAVDKIVVVENLQ